MNKIEQLKKDIQEIKTDMKNMEIDPDDYEKDYILNRNNFGISGACR